MYFLKNQIELSNYSFEEARILISGSFFLVAYFTNIFGKKFGNFIEKKGALWFSITGIFILVIAFVLYIIFT